MGNSVTDIERAFYAGFLGYSDDVLATKTLSQLRVDFTAAAIPKQNTANTWSGDQSFAKVGLNGNTPVAKAAAVTAPTVAGALYSQAQVQSIVDAVNAIRTALSNIGITA